MAAYNAGYDKKGVPLTEEALAKAQNPAQPNIQTIQVACLPSVSDMLEVNFAVGFVGSSLLPDACNSLAYREQLAAFIAAAREAKLYEELAGRYMWNIANGRALWRNGIGTDRKIAVTDPDAGATVTFNAAALPQQAFFPGAATVVEAADNQAVAGSMIQRVADALKGNGLTRFSISMRVRLYPGAEVWPSQEFPTEEITRRANNREVSRVLSSKPAQYAGRAVRHATMHSQKIGNALRTIDEWHGDNRYRAVPVEAFGWVQRDLEAIRKPGINDAYTLLRDVGGLAERLGTGDQTAREIALYVLAIMIRGGVFPMKSSPDEAVTTQAA
jgi:CRISPR-associated protein Csy3